MGGFTKDQILGFLQRVLMFGGGVAVGKGWISEQLMMQIVGAIIAIAGIAWGVAINTKSSLIARVDSIPEVGGVVMKPTAAGDALAARIPSETVVVAGTPDAVKVAK